MFHLETYRLIQIVMLCVTYSGNLYHHFISLCYAYSSRLDKNSIEGDFSLAIEENFPNRQINSLSDVPLIQYMYKGDCDDRGMIIRTV